MEQYVHDGDGKRIKKTDSDSERVYIYGGLNVIYEVNVTTQMNAVYIYGPTGKIGKKVNDMQEYYHTDHLGSTKPVTTENGVVTEEIQYEPFGEQINATEERYTYNGKERDENGLYYYGACYYDPGVGRFISRVKNVELSFLRSRTDGYGGWWYNGNETSLCSSCDRVPVHNLSVFSVHAAS